MKVLLVSTNRCREMVPPFPLGVALIASAVDRAEHAVGVWDGMFEDDWEVSLRDRLRAFGPDVIGFSVRNVDDQDIRAPRFFLDEVRAMADVCRQESSATLVGGGAGFGMFPAETVSFLGLQGGVVGEGERAFPLLLEALAAGRTPVGIPGVIWRDGGALASTPPEWSLRLDTLAFADRHAPDMARYYNARGTAGFPNAATIQAKRGCPLGCTYCATEAIEGCATRTRSPRSVADEVEQLAAQGFERIQFVDAIFTNPPAHARAVCEELIRRATGAKWSATVNPAQADREMLRLMKRAGCALVMVGNESGHATTLRSLGKPFGPEDVDRCFTACREEGLACNGYLLLGAPGENRDTVCQSVEMMQQHQPTHVSITVGVRLYPGCELTRVAREEGQLAPDAGLLTPRFYLAPGLQDWIWDYVEPLVAQHPNWSL